MERKIIMNGKVYHRIGRKYYHINRKKLADTVGTAVCWLAIGGFYVYIMAAFFLALMGKYM